MTGDSASGPKGTPSSKYCINRQLLTPLAQSGLCCATLGANGRTEPRPEDSDVDDIAIDKATAYKLLDQGARLFDVRSPGEFAQGALPGAVNLPVQVIAEQITDAAQTNETIVLYCRSGGRSDIAARILRAAGYAKAYNAGGIDDLL